jgi:uncharacterized membrane protein YhaH (DUF805 family)
VDWIAPFVATVAGAAALAYLINRWLIALVPAVVGIPLAWLLLGTCEVGPGSFATDCDAHSIALAFWTILGAAASLAMLVAVGVRRWRDSASRRGGSVRGAGPHL